MPVRVKGVWNDSRTIRKDYLYAAVKGERFDGHRFVHDALSRGASGAIVSEIPRDAESGVGALLLVDDTRKALMDMAAGYRIKVDPLMIGITGSAGKSSVKELIAGIFSVVGSTACTLGNWNNMVGMPLSILEMDNDTRAGVYEVGTSAPGEIAELCRVLKPFVGVITNIGPAHLQGLGSVEGVAREKSGLLSVLPDDGSAVVYSGSECGDILRSACACRYVSAGWNREDDYRIVPGKSGGSFILEEKSTGGTCRMTAPSPGKHNMVNAALAAAAARTEGMEWNDILTGLAKSSAMPMRWEEKTLLLGGSREVLVVNDAYNANPLSMKAAIDAFAEKTATGGKWLVLGDMLELGGCAGEEHRKIGQFAAKRMSGQSGSFGILGVGKFGKTIVDAASDIRPVCRISECENAVEAADFLRDRVCHGDAILLKASRLVGLEKIITLLEENNESR